MQAKFTAFAIKLTRLGVEIENKVSDDPDSPVIGSRWYRVKFGAGCRNMGGIFNLHGSY